MAEAEVSVNISATDNTAAATASAEDNFDQFEDHIDAGFERVAERLTEYFAVEKITEFVKDAITEFTAVERAMDVLGAQVRANGEDWDKSRASVDDFIASEQALTGATKSDVLAALSDAEISAKNLAAAFKITDEAERFSLITHHSVQQTIEEISRAYSGNTRGLRELGNELHLTNAQSSNAVAVFTALTQKTRALNGALNDTETQLNRTKAEWEDTQENVGAVLVNLLPVLESLEKIVATLLDSIFGLGKLMMDALVEPMTLAIQSTLNLAQAIIGLEDAFKHPMQGIKEMGTAIRQEFSDFKSDGNELTKDMSETGKQITAIWKTTGQSMALESDAAFIHDVELNAKNADAQKELKKQRTEDVLGEIYASFDASEKIKAQWSGTLKDLSKRSVEVVEDGSKEALKLAQDAVTRTKAQWEGAYAAVDALEKKSVNLWHEAMMMPSKDAEKAAKATEIEFQKHLARMLQLQKQHDAAMAALQKQKNAADALAQEKKDAAADALQAKHEAELTIAQKSLELASQSATVWKANAGIQKTIAVASATMDTALAVAQALSTYTWPMGAVVGGLVAAEGAVEIAKIESTSFASGGIVGGTSYDGDHVPAMVNSGELILNRAQQDNLATGIGGNTTHNHIWNFPGVTDRHEARAAGVSAGAAFMRSQNRAKVLSGNRGTRY